MMKRPCRRQTKATVKAVRQVYWSPIGSSSSSWIGGVRGKNTRKRKRLFVVSGCIISGEIGEGT